MNRPRTPADVARRLRQEAGFGCVICGSPILDYHHIIEWREHQHFETEHMVAVCPTHHRDMGKRSRDYAYNAKKNPVNLKFGKLMGELATDKKQPSFDLNGNIFKGVPIILRFLDTPIISYEIKDGQNLISLYIPDKDFWPEIEIHRNQFITETDRFWDIIFQTNYLRLNRKPGDRFLEIDLRGEHALISVDMNIAGIDVKFSSKSGRIGNTDFNGNSFEVAPELGPQVVVGLQIGSPKDRLIRPNFAMGIPRGRIVSA